MSHVITRKQKQALTRLRDFHTRYQKHDGFFAFFLGPSCAAALRRLDGSGLVDINKMAVNCFRYSITQSGKDFLDGKGEPA